MSRFINTREIASKLFVVANFQEAEAHRAIAMGNSELAAQMTDEANDSRDMANKLWEAKQTIEIG